MKTGSPRFRLENPLSPEPFVSRAKAPPAKRSEKGYGDENDIASTNPTSSPGPSARYPQQMALVQADVTGIVSGGSAKILFLFLIAQTGLNNAMRLSIVLKFCEFVVLSCNLSLLVSFSPLTLYVIKRSHLSGERAFLLLFAR